MTDVYEQIYRTEREFIDSECYGQHATLSGNAAEEREFS